MSHSRRVFLGASVMFAAASAFGGGRQAAQGLGQLGQAADPTRPQDPLGPPPPIPKPTPQAILKENQKEIRKNVERLTEAVADLRKALDDNDTKEVLSLDVVHKADEVEKLAKQVNELLRR
jgi:hypothetical protein